MSDQNIGAMAKNARNTNPRIWFKKKEKLELQDLEKKENADLEKMTHVLEVHVMK